ncbi:MAG: autotransporter assembly complex family protein [Gammaproteobacteria bacterium]
MYRPLHIRLLLLCLCFASTSAHAEITLRGLDKAQETNVRNALLLARTPCDAPEWQLRRQTAQAAEQIGGALEALGFYRSTVTVTTDPPKKKCWRKTVEVTPGPPTTYRTAQVRIEGQARDDPAFQKLLASQPLLPGAIVHHGRYRRFKRDLANLATARGYFDARFAEASVTVDETLAGAEAQLTFDSGERYTFGEVSIDSELLTERLFNVLQDIEPGSAYDANQIASTHRNFLDSGYFGFVNVSADPEKAHGQTVPVVIDVSPAKRRVYTGGLGFATDVGPRFRLNYRNRRINRRGHALDSQLLTSPVQSVLGLEYRVPIGDDRRDVLAFSTAFEEQDTDTSEFSSFELGARRTVARDSGWLNTAFIDLRREDFKVGDQDEVSTLLVPGMSWWRGTDTSSARPANAYRLAFDVRGTSTALGSDTSFIQVEARARVIKTLTERTRLLTRLNLGATAKESRDELPPSLRFFAGGDSSVRGYGFETIGPLNDDGVVIGGGKLLSASVEIDWKLSKNWAFAVFADTGSAFDDDKPDFKTGVGLGIRRLTPVGPLRLDLAAPLDRDRLVRLHVSIGSDL